MKKNIFYLGSILLLFMFQLLSNPISAQSSKKSAFTYDPSRIYHAMAKASRGEAVTVAFLGGSITQGYAASSEDKRWVNLVADWWKKTFPKSKTTLINAGIGGTGSNIGTFRLKDDVLSYRPDFVVFEYAVNDSLNKLSTAMMEGIARQLLQDPKCPGIMMLCLMDEKGGTAQPFHLPVANHYRIPLVSFADKIEAQVKKDGHTMHELFADGLHPLDLGMKYIAQFITDELSAIYKTLPAENKLPSINTTIPEPLITGLYANTFRYNCNNLAPDINNGWKKEKGSWVATEAGAELVFKVKGNSVAIQYTKHNTPDRGKAEVWLDNGEHLILDAYWTQTWGPATLFKLLDGNMQEGEHELHVKVLNEKSEGSNGNYFQLLNILIARESATKTAGLNFYGADDKKFQYTGRIDFSNPSQPRFFMPGSYVTTRFSGTACEVVLSDEVLWGSSYNYLEVVIDGRYQKRIQTTGKYNVIPVAENLPEGEHTILICKNTEANIGYIEFLGLRCKGLEAMPSMPTRKIEFIGNSITCGTGSDLSEIKCGKGNWHDQHNAYMAYGPLTARKLNAQWHLSSYSGIGLIHSCCGMKFVMPEVFDLINLTPGSAKWDFFKYTPDVVTICLGQNDGVQDSILFCDTYVKFIQKIRGYYPNAHIVCLTSPMGDAYLSAALKKYLKGIVDSLQAKGDKKVYKYFFSRQFASGCDYHPDLAEHQLIANELESFIREITGW